MDVTFFAANSDCYYTSFEEISESSILGEGFFTKDQISDLLSCFKYASSALIDCLWLLPLNFSEALSTIDDEVLKGIALNWSDEV